MAVVRPTVHSFARVVARGALPGLSLGISNQGDQISWRIAAGFLFL